jgi:proteasome lid subunit RPN8/RPN11
MTDWQDNQAQDPLWMDYTPSIQEMPDPQGPPDDDGSEPPEIYDPELLTEIEERVIEGAPFDEEFGPESGVLPNYPVANVESVGFAEKFWVMLPGPVVCASQWDIFIADLGAIGNVSQVEFPWQDIYDYEDAGIEIRALMHSHPPGASVAPSDTDIRTMKAWCQTLGHDMWCVIQCGGETAAWLCNEHGICARGEVQHLVKNVWRIKSA